jgi:hypothetical protein
MGPHAPSTHRLRNQRMIKLAAQWKKLRCVFLSLGGMLTYVGECSTQAGIMMPPTGGSCCCAVCFRWVGTIEPSGSCQ